MRPGPPDEVLAGACTWGARVTAWLGPNLLAADVPISSGRIVAKADDDILAQLTIAVPRWAAPADGGDVRDWRPADDPRHPLARYGQQLDVTIVVTSVITGQTWETRVGRFAIQNWAEDEAGVITVTAEDLLSILRDDKLSAPMSPGGSFVSETRRLMPAGIGVSFASALVDRSCPPAMSWSDSRLDAVREIAAAWPALLRCDQWGQPRMVAPLPAVPVPQLTFKDGPRGTLIHSPRDDSRRGAYNRVVAMSSNSDAADVQAVAEVIAGPMSVLGDYNIVTKKWSSPLLRTVEEAAAAASTMRDNSRRAAQTLPARIVPDPRPDLDDPVAIERDGAPPVWGWITGYDMPLTTMDGDMRIDVGLPV